MAAAAGNGGRRPPVTPQLPLPPWDPSDSGGTVHTVPPPEFSAAWLADPLYMRADFNGVTLDPDALVLYCREQLVVDSVAAASGPEPSATPPTTSTATRP